MKIQWPGFDAETVAEIEEYLGMAEDTEIVWRGINSRNPDIRREIEETDVYYFRARGAERKRYCRPMFEVFEDGTTSAVGRRGQIVTPCPACDDWSRTAVCTVHPELSLDEIQWHWQQALRWPDVYFGPPTENGYWAGDPEPDIPAPTPPPWLQDFLAGVHASYFGFEVSPPGEWSIDVA